MPDMVSLSCSIVSQITWNWMREVKGPAALQAERRTDFVLVTAHAHVHVHVHGVRHR